jgi:F0F1-type ATP synthase membrane subunit c/vacuolar-type H+-ATPase subunit K
MAQAGTIEGIIGVILDSLLNPLVPILIGLAIIIFAWGLFNYLKSGLGDAAELQGAKSLMFWGALIVFVMVSVWGLVLVLQNIFFGDSIPTVAPEIKTYNISSS